VLKWRLTHIISGKSPSVSIHFRDAGRVSPDALFDVDLMMSRNTILVPSLGLRIGPACETGLSVGNAKGACATPKEKRRKREEKRYNTVESDSLLNYASLELG